MALAALCERYGIEASFVDARGEVQTTSRATALAVLQAMGVKAFAERESEALFAADEREEWSQPLHPVHVFLPAAPLNVPVTLPAETSMVSWRLLLEDGSERIVESIFKTLQLLSIRKIDGKTLERRVLAFAEDLPYGYHKLFLASGEESVLVVSPGNCWLPDTMKRGGRVWGVATQLYLLKSCSNWGIGDYSDLRKLAEALQRRGADVLGLNPLHAMFPDEPEQASPYSPASRLLLNVLNIDVERVVQDSGNTQALALVGSERFRRDLEKSRASHLVAYSSIARMKMEVLRLVYDCLDETTRVTQDPAFLRFRHEAGATFERHCLFLALRAHFSSTAAPAPDWRNWLPEFKDPDSPAVAAFARSESKAVTFQVWLQYVADGQLAQAAAAAAPMAIGLYRDMAVGAAPGGAEAWANQRAVIDSAHVGCPPDIYNPAGQDWGLPPFLPRALRQEGYRSFVELVRANMRHAGALRIDHVMALQQLYWVPEGLSAAQGAFIRYPMEDLIGILALESHRNECLVVGEDLGTVPANFRERMAQAQILSYRVLFFEKEGETFIRPEHYPPLSLAVASSHDLPTLKAWLKGSDLSLKEQLGLFPNAQLRELATQERDGDRQQLLASLESEGFAVDKGGDDFADAAHGFLASTASAITMVQIDDLTLEEKPVNVPATSVEHPNWRRRLSMSIEEIDEDPHIQWVMRMMSTARAHR